MSLYLKVINDICNEENIKLTTISECWIHILEKDNQIHYINGYKFDINNSSIAQILDDKYAFYELMKYKNYPIIEHTIIFKNYDKKYIQELFLKYNKKIVIKANLGTCGREVFFVDKLDEAYKLIDELLIKNFSLSICPYVDIKSEYRVIVLDNNAELVYSKIKPIVVGDGNKSIKDLLIEFNEHYFKDKDLPLDILPKGKVYEYNWQFNLSKGASISTIIDKDLKNKLIKLATDITKDINIKFCSVDIIEDNNGNLFVMEANSGVMMDNFMEIDASGQEIAKKIYEKAIKMMFCK